MLDKTLPVAVIMQLEKRIDECGEKNRSEKYEQGLHDLYAYDCGRGYGRYACAKPEKSNCNRFKLATKSLVSVQASVNVASLSRDRAHSQIALITKGTQNHVRFLKSLKRWVASRKPKITAAVTAAGWDES
jgi:hypothetical protein